MENTRYENNDMVKIGCNDCKDCFDCCCGMGESIVLDPYDVYLLEKNLQCTFDNLLMDFIELHIVDGLILPNLKMLGDEECCGFLDENGRCGIHEFRPGLCRLFPLGREYAEGEVKYFVLEDVCQKQNQSKVKIKNWLSVPELKKYEQFLIEWHDFRKRMKEELAKNPSKDEIKLDNLKVLKVFYSNPYTDGDFYAQFAERMKQWNEMEANQN